MLAADRKQGKDKGSGQGKGKGSERGKGKGSVEYWVALIKPGKVLYEMEGVSEELAREAFALAAAKLPFATTFVRRTVM